MRNRDVKMGIIRDPLANLYTLTIKYTRKEVKTCSTPQRTCSEAQTKKRRHRNKAQRRMHLRTELRTKIQRWHLANLLRAASRWAAPLPSSLTPLRPSSEVNQVPTCPWICWALLLGTTTGHRSNKPCLYNCLWATDWGRGVKVTRSKSPVQ